MIYNNYIIIKAGDLYSKYINWSSKRKTNSIDIKLQKYIENTLFNLKFFVQTAQRTFHTTTADTRMF